ncbi:MAG: YqaJ viral recombinase family protein [Desulfosporosinus sp.]|nr:YqaJ viral recombinase family protein [Desulfosporosinus sp.]
MTASDVPTICGENAFSTADSVLRKKVFKFDSVDTPATLHGKTFEPVAIAEFCERTGAVVVYPGYVLHNHYPWLGGTVDGIATMTRDVTLNGILIPVGTVVVIEVKCPYSRQIKESELPGQYVGQVQTYMEILDLEICIFIQYKPPGVRAKAKFTMLAVPRDRVYMALRLPYLKKFWDKLNIMNAYVNTVVTVIQRAWRMYLARRAFDGAAKRRMILSLSCASIVGKIAGFMRKKEIDEIRAAAFMFPPIVPGGEAMQVWVDFTDADYGHHVLPFSYSRRPVEAARPAHTGEILVSY